MAMNRCAVGLTTVMPETTFIVTSPGMVRTNLSRNFAARSWTNTILGKLESKMFLVLILQLNWYLVNTLWHGLGRFLLHSPASGAQPGIKACTDDKLKSGSYLTQKGLEDLEDDCLDQALISDALQKSDELIKAIRSTHV